MGRLIWQVVNQTLIAKEDAEFCPMYGVQPGTQRFNDTFGDCYISGKARFPFWLASLRLTVWQASSLAANSPESFPCE
jgi:hypothetical protein